MRRRSTWRASLNSWTVAGPLGLGRPDQIDVGLDQALRHHELDQHVAELGAGVLEPAHRVEDEEDEDEERQQAEQGLERQRRGHLRRAVATELAHARDQHVQREDARARQRGPLLAWVDR